MPAPTEPSPIPGVELVDVVGRGARTVVYRARRGGRMVAVKMPLRKNGVPSDDARLRFRREAAWLACLDHPALPPVLELGEATDGRPYVVTPFVEGPTLAAALRRGALPEPDVVSIAIAAAEVLDAVHRRGLVHRDVKPDNLVLGPGRRVMLLDFDLAGIEGDQDGGLTGSLLYAAPEQLGLLSRPVDARADLWSLGAVLFHAASGRPPFRAAHPTALWSQRAADERPALADVDPRASPAFARLVDRLLSVDPDHRYQSSRGLLSDLGRLDDLNQRIRRGQPIRLDPGRSFLHGHDPLPLMGRKRELDQLLDAFTRAGRRQGGFQIVEGPAGVGKTRLVRELGLTGRHAGGTVLFVQCVAGERAPYAGLRRALERWMLEAASDGTRAEGRVLLSEVSAGLATPLIRVAPALAEVLPPDRRPSPVPGRKQIEAAIAELLLRLADRVGPLILVLDDAQWLSQATGRMLRRLARRIETAPLLVVVTHRPGDQRRPPLSGLFRDLRQHTSGRVVLGPLDDDAARLFCRAMVGGCTIPDPLLMRILETTGCNPMALRESLRLLVETGGLLPGRTAEAAATDLSADRDVPSALHRRLDLLSERAREVLAPGALVGGGFSVTLLAETTGHAAATVNAALTEAMRSSLVQAVPPGRYAFTHPWVREAVAEGVNDARRPSLHLRIAEVLEAVADEDPASLCTLAQQYAAAGLPLAAEKILETNFTAGRVSLRMRAFDEARGFLRDAAAAADHLGRIVPALDEVLAEALYRTGEVEAARSRLESVVRHATDAMRRARAYRRLSGIHLLSIRPTEALEAAERAFAELGEPMGGRLGRMWRAGAGLVRGRTGARESPRPTRLERDRLLVDLYLHTALVGYFGLRRDLFVEMRLAALGPAARIGPSDELVNVHAQVGLLLEAHGRRGAERHLSRAAELAESLDDPAARATVAAVQARRASLRGRVVEADRLGRLALERHGAWLDTHEYTFTAADLVWHLIVRGHTRDAWTWTQRAFAESEDAEIDRGAVAGHPYLHVSAMACLATFGEPDLAELHLEQATREPEEEMSSYRRIAILGHRLIMLREGRDLGPAADEALEAVDRLEARRVNLPLHLQLVHAAAGYLAMDRAAAAPAEAWPAGRRRLMRRVKVLRRAISPLLRGHGHVLSAALDRALGRRARAHRRLARAEALGDALDAPWVIYETLCERARLLAEEGADAASRRAAAGALDIARRQGWRPRVMRLRAEFAMTPTLRRKRPRGSSETAARRVERAVEVSLSPVQGGSPAAQVRLVLDGLLRLFGAERALLFRYDRPTGELVYVSGRDVRGNQLGKPDPASRALVEESLATRAPVCRPADGETPIADGRSPPRAIAAPLMRKGGLAGVIYLDHRLPGLRFNEDDLEMLRTIAGQIPVVMESAAAGHLEIYERLAANVPGLVFQMVQGKGGGRSFRFVSRAVRHLGLSPEEVRRDPEALLDRIHPDDRDRFERGLERASGDLRTWTWEGRYFTSGDSVRWYHGAARPERQPGGEVFWDGVLVDVTRLKAAEEEIRSLNQVLEQRVALRTQELSLANRELEAFTYSVSHDLRAPLLTIKGYGHELVDHVGVGGEAEQFARRILAAADQMEVLIEAMLSLSRVAHQPLERRSLDLSRMADEILGNLRMREPERRVEATIEPGLAAEADPTLVRIALENLLSNAWKFTRGRDPAEIRFFARERDGERIFMVADNGVGFDMRHGIRLFQPFERLHRPRDFEGSGVGLATVRRVVQRHGGRIWAEGAPGEGARFHFTLAAPPIQRFRPGRR